MLLTLPICCLVQDSSLWWVSVILFAKSSHLLLLWWEQGGWTKTQFWVDHVTWHQHIHCRPPMKKKNFGAKLSPALTSSQLALLAYCVAQELFLWWKKYHALQFELVRIDDAGQGICILYKQSLNQMILTLLLWNVIYQHKIKCIMTHLST